MRRGGVASANNTHATPAKEGGGAGLEGGLSAGAGDRVSKGGGGGDVARGEGGGGSAGGLLLLLLLQLLLLLLLLRLPRKARGDDQGSYTLPQHKATLH